MLLTNAKLPPTVFTSVMSSLVVSAKSKEGRTDSTLPLSSSRAEVIIGLLKGTTDPSENQRSASVAECVRVLKAAKKRLSSQAADSALVSFLSLSDAILALDETTIDMSDGANASTDILATFEDAETFSAAADRITEAFLAHTA